MKLNKPLMHCRLSEMQFFYWDPRIDPREPEYKLSQPPSTGGFFYVLQVYQSKSPMFEIKMTADEIIEGL